MGMYDTIHVNGREGQVKIWAESRGYEERYELGDEVPVVRGLRNFAIEMNEGGYVVVIGSKIKMWVEWLDEYFESENHIGALVVVDKYGEKDNRIYSEFQIK